MFDLESRKIDAPKPDDAQNLRLLHGKSNVWVCIVLIVGLGYNPQCRGDWKGQRVNVVSKGAIIASGFRVGIGEDTHRLTETVSEATISETEPGGSLRLGGIDIPHDRQLVGHSDADVLLHAITDALLGAAGLPDIGQLFPNTDEANRGRDSAQMLAHAAKLVAEAGYGIVNLDCVVAAQRPKLANYKQAICLRVAEILAIQPSQIGLKAKTGEHVGPVGREEAIDARCIVLLENTSSV